MMFSIAPHSPALGDSRKSLTIAVGMAALVVMVAVLLFVQGVVDQKIAYGLTGLVTLGPVLVYAMVKRPVLSFAAYAMIVPLENLIHIGSVGTLAKGLGAAAAVVLIAALLLKRKAVPLDRSTYVWLVFVLWMSASVFWAIDPNFSGVINALQVAQLFVLYAIIAMTPMTTFDLSMVIIASTLGGLIGGLYSINQYMHGARPSNGSWDRLVIKDGDNTIDSNHFAAALQLPLALTAVAVLYARRTLPRLLFCGVLGVMLIALLLGASRGGIIAFGIVTIYLAFRTRRVKSLLAIAAVALGASLSFPSVWARFNDPTQGEGSGRLDIWRIGFDALKHNWLLGVGEGNFQVAYDRSFLRVHQIDFQGWSRPSHNTFLGMATELGLVGIVLFIYAGRRQFMSVSCIPRGDELFPVRVAVEAAFLALVTESMFLDVFWYKYVWMTFAMMAAVRSTYLSRQPEAPPESPRSAGVAVR